MYVREAHALDSAAPRAFAGSDGALIEDPITLDERERVAGRCVADLELPMPALVDGMDDAVNARWKGWPDRLYVVGKDGRIAYAGGRGPMFFAPDDWERAIEAALAK